ncbi:hypothetical protein PsorP6_009856 [Peronosclerospora sorghi]|uniref:Uncharacterized protein n=1 Tax=Peronosclerospora sorghi TaxID=230839 RepID=A0ACC0VZF2_9STRA|nr:hypothetical protein PsorP6_009856 [Peronosclerospora sorghi]
MELKRVGAVPMRRIVLEILGQVDDINGLKRTLFHTDATPDAQLLRDERDFTLGTHFNAEFPHAHDGARLFTLLTTFLWLALVGAHNGNTRQFVRHVAALVFSSRVLKRSRRLTLLDDYYGTLAGSQPQSVHLTTEYTRTPQGTTKFGARYVVFLRWSSVARTWKFQDSMYRIVNLLKISMHGSSILRAQWTYYCVTDLPSTV